MSSVSLSQSFPESEVVFLLLYFVMTLAIWKFLQELAQRLCGSRKTVKNPELELDEQRHYRFSRSHSAEDLREEMLALKETLSSRQQENTDLEYALNQEKTAHMSLQDEYQGVKTSLKETQERYTTLQRHFAAQSRAAKDLEANEREYETRLRTASCLEASAKLQEKQGQLHLQLQDCETQLRAAQEYVKTSDSTSGAEVIAMMTKLNTTILDTAANMTDRFTSVERAIGRPRSEDVQIAQASVEAVLNHHANVSSDGSVVRRILDRLATTDHRENPFLLQSTIQTAMCACVELLVTSWALAEDTIELLLNDTYRELLKSEKYVVATRWRTLTRKHLRAPDAVDIENFVQAIVSDILVCAGVVGSTQNPMEKVKRFSDAVQSLYVAPGDPFSMSAMDPATSSSQTTEMPEVTVILTTDLGLRRSRKTVDDQWEEDVLLKARVLLPNERKEGGNGVELRVESSGIKWL